MSHPHNVVLGKSRYKQTKKWTHILSLLETVSNGDEDDSDSFEDSFQHAVGVDEERRRRRRRSSGSDDDGGINSQNERSPSKSTGSGIQFLPGDIKGLQTKLNYLLAEYRAGNRSPLTRNEIVSILDELLRRKKISRKEYRDINTFLQ